MTSTSSTGSVLSYLLAGGIDSSTRSILYLLYFSGVMPEGQKTTPALLIPALPVPPPTKPAPVLLPRNSIWLSLPFLSYLVNYFLLIATNRSLWMV